jgi:hypothetical protein
LFASKSSKIIRAGLFILLPLYFINNDLSIHNIKVLIDYNLKDYTEKAFSIEDCKNSFEVIFAIIISTLDSFGDSSLILTVTVS